MAAVWDVGRGVRAVVQQRPPRHRREVADLDRRPTSSARDVVAPLRRRAETAASSSSATRPRRSTSSPRALPPGTQVLSTPVEHHANMLPWRRHDLRLLPFTDLARRSCSTRRRARCAHAASTCSRSPAPPTSPARCGRSRELAALAHAHGAQLFVDAAQLAPHRAIDMAATGIDHLALSGHKLYAPFGAGALVSRAPLDGDPLLHGGGAIKLVTLDDVDLGRRARPLRGRLAERDRRRRASPPPARRCDDRHGRRSPTASARSPRACTPAWTAIPGLTTLALWPGHADRVGVASFTLDGLQATATLAAAPQRRVRDRRPPRLLLRAPAAHAAAQRARRRGASGCTPSCAGRPRARAARSGPGEHRARHDDRGHRRPDGALDELSRRR